MLKKTLFIDESPVYGGHEEMFLRLLTRLDCANEENITILVNEKNKKLIEEVENFKVASGKKINLVTHLFSGYPIRPLTNIFAWRDALAIYRTIKKGHFSQVLVVQGTVEIGGLSLLIARMAGCKVMSYLPITKRSRLLGVTLGGVRDWINRKVYYQLAHQFITISDFNKKEMVDDFDVPEEKIRIVYNFTDEPSSGHSEKPVEFTSKVNFLLIGRIDFLQKKQQDFLRALVEHRSSKDLCVHVVGDNDSAESQILRAEFANRDNIVFHGWCNARQISALLQSADGVIMPSRFEGVPLVMIEAVKMGRRVLGSDVDGMKEFLPQSWRFPVGDYAQAVRMMESASELGGEDALLLQKTQAEFASKFNPERSAAAFNSIIHAEETSPKILLDCRLMTKKPTGIARYSEKFLEYYIAKYGKGNVTALLNEPRPDIHCQQQVITLKAFNLLHWFQFPGWLKRQRYSHYISFHYSGLMRPVKGVKSAVTVHDLMYELVPEFFSGWLKKLIGRRYFRFLVGRSMASSDLIFSVSSTTRQDVTALYGLDSAVTGEGLFLTAEPDATIITALGLSDKSYLLYIGNNRPHKNINALLAAFREVRQHQPDLSLVLVGHTAESSQEGVIYPGFVSDEELVALYQHARAFVFPSLYEGFGLPIIEALANGCPVIASDIPAFREFANDNIRYFELGNQQDLITLMQAEIAFIPDQAAAILQRFSWKSTWRNLDNILDGWL